MLALKANLKIYFLAAVSLQNKTKQINLLHCSTNYSLDVSRVQILMLQKFAADFTVYI